MVKGKKAKKEAKFKGKKKFKKNPKPKVDSEPEKAVPPVAYAVTDEEAQEIFDASEPINEPEPNI